VLKKLKHEKLLQGKKWHKLGSGKISFKTNKKGKKETKVFQRLKFIVEALMGQECFSTSSKTSHKCNFNYHDCGDTQMVGENAGSTFQIDCQRAKLHARIKPTALCSVFDKENSTEFLLDLVHYIYMQSNPNPVLLSCASL